LKVFAKVRDSLALMVALLNIIRRITVGKRVLRIAAKQGRPYNLAKGD
jgi:hypothetical protein